ncbi:Aim19p NDAI_0B03500 [Naumovozyma dairenensis CBS 421]|uniref:Uncharacterized protein n=1 Tax=Naumovozyma dairenensis (strain ATCC 10597 / BCRC 20456 / CBS 421 / NBRC 0211 / NRRL Y-12639) TaxID=1071378 RepID=G0W6H3_NAUDC|nr:hypothetical protein NDAI_0B03500 [Naumovozyma dairenensis CBS 421]CCD23384.1 hypothetical protein NDAI_0B03500 [Naumovozyma dairenensis CBS 421]
MTDKSIEELDQVLTSETKSLWKQAYEYTNTPLPAIINAGLIFATPVLSPQFKTAISTTTSGAVPFLSKGRTSSTNKYIGLSNKNILLFGAAQALGAKMLSDGDIENGSGFVTAWSILFLIVNGKRSLNSLKVTKIWPMVLCVGSLGNSILYGKRFISGGFK